MANSVFLKLDGITGDSNQTGFEEQLELGSWDWGGHNSARMDTGGRRTQGSAEAQPIACSKEVDAASVELYKRVFEQKMIPEAVLSVTALFNGAPMVYLELKMKNLYVSDYSVSGHGDAGGSAQERFSLTFSEVKWKYVKRDPETGDEKGAPEGGFTVATGEVS